MEVVTKATRFKVKGHRPHLLMRERQSHVVNEHVQWEILLWLFWGYAICPRAALGSIHSPRKCKGKMLSRSPHSCLGPTESSLLSFLQQLGQAQGWGQGSRVPDVFYGQVASFFGLSWAYPLFHWWEHWGKAGKGTFRVSLLGLSF